MPINTGSFGDQIIFHLRLCEKVTNLLRLMHLEKGLPSRDYSLENNYGKLADVDNVSPALIEGGQNTLAKMRRQLSGYLLKALEYEEKEAICGEHRNSYYKTDHDATATCLKEDYYSGLGSQMHAAYNAQIVVSNGFVVSLITFLRIERLYVHFSRQWNNITAGMEPIRKDYVLMLATAVWPITNIATRKG